MAVRDLYLICFAAGSVIHGAQTVLAAKLQRHRTGHDRVDARDFIAIGITTFFWQFGNFLAVLASTPVANFMRDGALVCFPLLFSTMCLHIPDDVLRSRTLLGIGRYLRYPLWPWTALALTIMVAADAGVRFPILGPNLVAQVTLYIMLFYFVIFAVTSLSFRSFAKNAGVAAIIRAQKASIIASFLGVTTFVLMLTGYWHVPIPFFRYIELAAMMTSVPFTISVAYRLYQFPFMDVFVREVLSGVILLAAFVAALSAGSSILWITACAIVLAYLKEPLTRWVERTFMGYEEAVEEQEHRIGTAIRALTRLDEFGARVSEILANELEAEWVEIKSTASPDAIHQFEIAGSGLSLALGPRVGRRHYMSRQLRIARTAALQLAAHHHQLGQHAMREVTARAQMQALQAQINPHFLFNTLNVLANLIHSDPAKAERVTEELADIFRYALESTRVESVTLDDELHFLESYLEIEKARFGERLAYSFDIGADLRKLKIPPMILQPLVENAIRHGIGQKVEGGEVRISGRLESDRVVIVVEDTGVGHRAASRYRGTGIGLTNVRERLRHLYGDVGTLELEEMSPSGTRAVVIMPQWVGVHS
jgi:signal transduction histidine kinase